MAKKQTSSTWFIFLRRFASGHVQAKCGPGINYMGWDRFFHSDIITISIKRYWKQNNGKISYTLAVGQIQNVGLGIIGAHFGGLTVRLFSLVARDFTLK